MNHATDSHFREFAKSLEREIEKYGEFDGDFYNRQKGQVEGLLALEDEFRRTLIGHRWGASVYRDFIKYICETRRNILAARPFFRERQEVFTQEISKALKERAEKGLFRFKVNYQFILFVMRSRRWGDNRMGFPLVKLAEKIAQIRTELVEMNMPLAISRARIFWSRTPKSHLSYMDLVQIAAEGLMAGIDKYDPGEGGFSKVFRDVAIGRMVGNFIEEYSETLIHFYPADKRKIYRANKAVGRNRGREMDFAKLASEVNDGAKDSNTTNATEIADLMAAASTVSADMPVLTERSDRSFAETADQVSRFAAPDDTRPDIRVEEAETVNKVLVAMSQLTIFERKLLRLKGVSFK